MSRDGLLTPDELVEMHRARADERVLNVYVDARPDVERERRPWPEVVDDNVDAARARAEEDGEEDAFDTAWSLLSERLAAARVERGDGEGSPDKAWVGFATPEEVVYESWVPVTLPHLVRWEDGIRVAPYLRGLKQARPVVLALVDRERARLIRWHRGELDEPRNLRADTFTDDLTDVGQRKGPEHRSGVRGKTATDAAQTFLDEGADQLRKHLVQEMVEMTGDDGLLILGGSQEMTAALARDLPDSLEGRVVQRPGFHFNMSGKELVEGISAAASELTQRRQGELLEQIVEAAGAGGKGTLGIEEALAALLEHRVDTLLVSRSLVEEEGDMADNLVGQAFAQGAVVEEVSGETAERLDREGGAVAARLRYRP